MSLHQPHWARRFARRIVALRSGRVVFDGPPTGLTDARVEELYRGDDIISLEHGTAEAGTIQATPA